MGEVQTDCVFFEVERDGEKMPIGIMMLTKEQNNDRTDFTTPEIGPSKWVAALSMVLGQRIAEVEHGVQDRSLRNPVAFHAMWSAFAKEKGLIATHAVFDASIEQLKEFDFNQLRERAEQAAVEAPGEPISTADMPASEGELEWEDPDWLS